VLKNRSFKKKAIFSQVDLPVQVIKLEPLDRNALGDQLTVPNKTGCKISVAPRR
jgi:hypothetical protein